MSASTTTPRHEVALVCVYASSGTVKQTSERLQCPFSSLQTELRQHVAYVRVFSNYICEAV